MQSTRRTSPRYSVLVWSRILGAVLLFFALDSAAFRTGWYASALEPNSTAGFLQETLFVEEHRASTGGREVIAIGDSRIPLKPSEADAAGTGYRFFTIAVPGTSPRCWYYMLRVVDPDARRYAAIVIPFDTYDDRNWEDLREREMDMRYLAPLVSFRDLFDFSLSYPQWDRRGRAASTVLFKGLIYREDLQDLLVRHKSRMTLLRDLQSRKSGWRYDASWDTQSLAGMSVDWKARRVELPEYLPAKKAAEIREVLLTDQPPWTAEFADYRKKWLGKIVAHYRGSRTRLIFVRLARGPVVRPGLATDTDSTVREFGARAEAMLVPEHRFDELERPELFGDALHMNQQGAVAFSGMLAHEVAGMLGR
jgi:hypothetical protein